MSLEKTLADAGMHIVELATELPDQPFTPRRRLLWEVLRQAFADMGDVGSIRDMAEEWFSASDASKLAPDNEWETGQVLHVTFLGLCEELGLTPLRIRTAALDPSARAIILDRLRREWREGMTKQESAL